MAINNAINQPLSTWVGSTSVTTVGTIVTGTWTGTLIGTTYGGTGANLTASISNGGIVYSNASTLAILAGTATANRVILSGSSTTPAWSTATYPATTTINQILYSSSANTITGLSTVASAVLTTVSSVPTWASTLGLTLGGTGASLSASNGGVVYSNASTLAVLAGTATANQILMSGASTTPAWSTTTYPATSATGNMIYASGTNTYTNLAPNSSATVTQMLSMINSTPSWFTLNAVNAQSGTTYTVVLSDFGKLITFNNASAITVTLPQQSTTATAAGFFCWFLNIGAGQVTVIKQGTETLSGNVILNQYAECRIERPTTTSWATFGGTATIGDCFTMSIGGALLNQAYDIISYAPVSGTILGICTKSTSLGTAGTYTVAINGSTVTGLSAIANSTSRTYTSASAANTFNRGDYITITLAGTVTGVDLFATLDITRNF